MTRIFALLVTVMAIAMAALAADESPGEQPDSFDIEPPILKENLSEEPLLSTAAPDGGVGRLEKQLERAKRKARGTQSGEKLLGRGASVCRRALRAGVRQDVSIQRSDGRGVFRSPRRKAVDHQVFHL